MSANEPPPQRPDAGGDERTLDAMLHGAFGRDAPSVLRPSAVRAIEALAGIGLDPGDPSLPEGRYEVYDRIGRGGIGLVYEGRDRDLERTVAIKVLREEREDDPEVRRRFVEEARFGGRLEHPGIVPVYDLGVVERGLPFLAMKLVRGRTLAAALEEREPGQRDLPHLLRVFERICQAVAYAHARGVVHRDLKPANVMLGTFGEVQVMDWGLAKGRAGTGTESSGRGEAPLPETENATLAGAVLGTPAYMAPEQAAGRIEAVGPASDVFALGAILCEILTGHPPYPGPTARALLAARAGDLAAAHARLEASGAHGDLVALCARCLAADPAERPPDAGVLARRLAEHLDARERAARDAEVVAVRARVQAQEERARADLETLRVEGARRSRRRVRVTAALALGAILLAALVVSWRSHEDRRHRARATAEALAAAREAAALEGQGALEAALAAARRSRSLATESDLGERGVREIEDREARLAAAAAARQASQRREAADEALLADLEQAYLHGDDAQVSYERAFREHGLDPETQAAEALGRAVAERPRAADIAAHLEHWALLRSRDPSFEKAQWQPLLAASALAHDTPWRRRLHEVALGGDLDALKRLAQEADVDDVPLPTVREVGLLLSEKGDHILSADFLRRALARRRGDVTLSKMLRDLLVARRQTSQRQEAVAHAMAAVAARPGHGCAWSLLGMTLREAGRPDLAVAACAHGLEQGFAPDHPEHHLELGNAHALAGDIEAAISAYDTALQRYPAYFQAAANRAHALVKVGRASEALTSLDVLLESHGDQHLLQKIRAEALTVLGRPREARASLEDAVRRWPTRPGLYLDLGELLAEGGDNDGAIRVLTEGVGACPPHFGLHYNLGCRLLDAERHDEAYAAFASALELRNDDADAWNNLGLARRGQGRLDEAVEAMRRAVTLDPLYAEAWSNLGTTLDDQGKLEEAVEALDCALEVDPDLHVGWHNLGYVRMRMGDGPGAIEALERALELDTTSRNTLYLLGVVHCDILGEFDAAIRRFREAIALGPPPAFFFISLGVAHRKKGDLAGALAALEDALRANPRAVRAWMDLGWTHFGLEAYDEAAKAWQKALQIEREHVPAMLALVSVLADCPDPSYRRPDDALPLVERLIEMAPDQAPPWVYLALIHLRAGRPQEASPALEKAISVQGEAGPRIELLRALAWIAQGRREEARAAYERAVVQLEGLAQVAPEVLRYREEAAGLLATDQEPGDD